MKYLELTKVCESCNKEFARRPEENVGNFKRNKTCSKKCRYNRLSNDSYHLDDSGYLRHNRSGERLHRQVMETYLGRELDTLEEVHHIDGDKLNNHISNLTVLPKAEHTRITFKGKKRAGVRGSLINGL